MVSVLEYLRTAVYIGIFDSDGLMAVASPAPGYTVVA
ncbi:hypothetical protein SAMN04488556_3660 [Halostagnicola kamekurae]|uniref:Uncharacterized protein n=1 Tax=Halostagnicola kamekurae TaxID=619731 RepID=A0A1I6U9J5_9EURY|nr:hypothetical protein SAMN04488556_3660 [Halostagnicola kamekurae]